MLYTGWRCEDGSLEFIIGDRRMSYLRDAVEVWRGEFTSMREANAAWGAWQATEGHNLKTFAHDGPVYKADPPQAGQIQVLPSGATFATPTYRFSFHYKIDDHDMHYDFAAPTLIGLHALVESVKPGLMKPPPATPWDTFPDSPHTIG